MSGMLNLMMSMGGGAASFTPVTVIHQQGDNVQHTETAPVGCSNVVIELIGASGGGGQGAANPCTGNSGSGAGSGGYTRSSYAITGGQTLLYTSGAAGVAASSFGGGSTSGGESSVFSGTLTIQQMLADPGTFGAGGGFPGTGGAGGGGNAASGNGNNGVSGASNPGAGGAGVVGVYATGAAGGNGGFAGQLNATNGGPGIVVFHYT